MAAMTGLLFRRLRLLLAVALCAAWAATPLIAQICAETPVHCRRHMPCCPYQSSRRGENCAPGLCPAEASQRAVRTRTVRAPLKVRIASEPVRRAAEQRIAIPESIAGLQYRAAVFRLKDDLRI